MKTLRANWRGFAVLAGVAFGALLLAAKPAQAAPVFFGWGGDKIVKIADLPQTQDYLNTEGKHVDLGYRFKQVTVFFIPIYNYDEHWCGYLNEELDAYVPLSDEQARDIARSAGVTLPGQPIPDWDLWQGKLLVGAGVVAFLIYSLRKRKTAAEAPPAPAAQTSPPPPAA